MPFTFLGMHPKTSYKAFDTQATRIMGSQVTDAPSASKMAVYQDAYRNANALLRQKTFKTQAVHTVQDGSKATNIISLKDEDKAIVSAARAEADKLKEEVSTLKTLLADAYSAHMDTQQCLDNAHCSADILSHQLDGLSNAYSQLVADNVALERSLSDALTTIEADKVYIGETLTALYIEQEKTKALEAQLAKSDDLLLDALNSQLDVVVADMEATYSESTTSEFSFSASTYELELERDMYQSQEQEALEALEAEKTARLALEKALQVAQEKEQQAIAVAKAHEQARTVAEKEVHEASIQLQAALATVAELTSAILAEDDFDTTPSDVETECSGLMDSSDDLKTFEFVTPKKMKAVWKPYQSTNKSRSCLTSKTGYLGLSNADLFAETPFKVARSNKENVGYVFQTPHPIRSEGLVFCDPVGIRNAPSTPASGDPNPFMAAAVHGYSDVNTFGYFDVTASLSSDNFEGTAFVLSAPALS